jgi:hypothetical protein
MNDEQSTPESMPQELGDNIAKSEKAIGNEAYKLARQYERLLNKHAAVLAEIHATIIAFGRLLQEGKNMYGPGKEFGQWVERRHLNVGKLCSTQQERTACMTIAKLHDTGPDSDGDDNIVPGRLDLTDCKRTRPTDIMKWARKEQPHLFPHLHPPKARVADERGKKKNSKQWITDAEVMRVKSVAIQAIKRLKKYEPEAAQVLSAQLDDPDPDDDIGEM